MKTIACFCLLLIALGATGQKIDRKLESKLKVLLQGYPGDAGVYVKNLRTGKIVMINADTVFPTASIVKVSIQLGIMRKMQLGQLHYDSTHIYRDSLLYEGEDILGSFRDGEKIALNKIIMLMLTTSDNTASLWLQKLAGGGTAINALLDSLGYKNTRVNSRTPGREAIRTIYGWGQTTPAEMGRLLEQIYNRELLSPALSDRMARNLSRNFWDKNEATSMLPPYVSVWSKNGCVDASRSEVLLVNAPNNPYVFCIFTKKNKDTSWNRSNAGWTLARNVSATLWDYFEPKDKWDGATVE